MPPEQGWLHTPAQADAYRALYLDQRDRLFRIAWLWCGDAQVAEDAVAEAFVAVHAPWSAGAVHDPAAYLAVAVVNRVRAVRRRAAVGDRVTAAWEAAPEWSPPPDQGVAERLDVRHALDALSDDHRDVVVLRYYADLSEAAIADALGVPAGTVKSRTARALEHLRVLLGDDDG